MIDRIVPLLEGHPGVHDWTVTARRSHSVQFYLLGDGIENQREVTTEEFDLAVFNDDHRFWQDQFDTRRIADRIDELLVSDKIDDHARGFIESRDMFFLATCDEDGNPQCSYKGGDPGFVRVVDDRTLAFPVFDGNGMFLSLGNIRAHASSPVAASFCGMTRSCATMSRTLASRR